jgi:hypothetical protein
LSVGNNGGGYKSVLTRRRNRFIAAAIEAAMLRIVKDKRGNKSERIDRLVETMMRKAEKGDLFAFNSACRSCRRPSASIA